MCGFVTMLIDEDGSDEFVVVHEQGLRVLGPGQVPQPRNKLRSRLGLSGQLHHSGGVMIAALRRAGLHDDCSRSLRNRVD